MTDSVFSLGLGLGTLVSPWFLLLVAFVGVNLIQSTFTGFCPAETLLARLGVACPTSSGRSVADH